jgi:hypothetical protein
VVENDPWQILVTEVFDSYRAQMKRRVKRLKNGCDFSGKEAKEQTRVEFTPKLNQTFREKYIAFLKRMRSLRKDSTYKKIADTANRLRVEDDMDWEESIEEAVIRRKLLLARVLDDWNLDFEDDDGHDDDDDDEDDDNDDGHDDDDDNDDDDDDHDDADDDDNHDDDDEHDDHNDDDDGDNDDNHDDDGDTDN